MRRKSNSRSTTGVPETWLHNDSKLSDQIALRSEIGLDAGIHLPKVQDFPKNEEAIAANLHQRIGYRF